MPKRPTRIPAHFDSRAGVALAALALVLLTAASPAAAVDGVLEINQVCATGPGCFSGDAAGLPVTLAARGSYRLTSNLNFNSLLGPPSQSFIEVTAEDVQLDLNGFSLNCSNSLTGATCTGSTAAGISLSGAAQRVRIRNGTIHGMPGDGIFGVNANHLQIEDLIVSENGATGVQAGIGSRVERCTAVDNGDRGFYVGFASVLIGNVARGNGNYGVSVGSNAVLRDNVASGNDGSGFRIFGGSVVEGNSSTGNGQAGFSLLSSSSQGGLARENTATANTGVGMSLGSTWVFTENVMQTNNGGSSNAQTSGGIQGSGNYCGTTLGCP